MSRFPSKVMLFGEYAVIKGSQALAMPYPRFNGELSETAGQNEGSLQLLQNWLEYLRGLNDLQLSYDWDRMEADIANGLSFDCSAPIGYGLGSSGIIVASLFERYAIDKNKLELPLIQKELGKIESFFHGKSSGLDPLISYVQKPLLIAKDSVKEVSISDEMLKPIWLLNTDMKRKTAPLVNIFLEKCNQNFFAQRILPDYLQGVDRCINRFLASDKEYLQDVRQLSIFQHNHMKEMIPSHVMAAWELGLTSSHYHLKLCGAGGGGFMLAFIHQEEGLQRLQKMFDMIPLYEAQS